MHEWKDSASVYGRCAGFSAVQRLFAGRRGSDLKVAVPESRGNQWKSAPSGWLLVMLMCLLATAAARAGDDVETAGDVLLYILPTTAGALTLGKQDYRGTLQFGESLALTEGITYGLKYTVHETRPNGGAHSFPSEHTSVSFSAAEFMRKRYGWEFGVPAYAGASFVAYSRVESGNHWAHDVIAGAGIGIASSYLFTRPYSGWRIEVSGTGRGFGFALSHAW